MVLQSQQVVVYRMVDDAGREYALSRFILPKDVLIALNDGRFPQCLKELMSISHGCLRPVIDGGLDPVDRSPWLATYWWEGKPLQDRLQDKEISGDDVHRIEEHARAVMAGVGQFASFLNFDPGKIVAVQGSAGEVVETFTIDLYQWFLSWATGRPPAPDREPNRQLSGLLSKIRKNIASPLPRNTTHVISPPQTTSMNSGIMPVAGPVTGMIRPVATSAVGTVQHAKQANAMKHNPDPLAAYRKKATTGQKAGVTAAVLFIAAAVGGIGWFVLQERNTKQAIAKKPKEQKVVTPSPEKKVEKISILERLRNKAELERAQAKKISVDEPVVPKAIVLEEGDGPTIVGVPDEPEIEEPPSSDLVLNDIQNAKNLKSPEAIGARPDYENMVELYSEGQIQLNSIQKKWVIITGKIQSQIAEGIQFEGPSRVIVKFAEGITIDAGIGDTVEIIGWVDPNGGNPLIFMQKADDLDILEKVKPGQEPLAVYGVADQKRLKNLAGNNVTVVARVVALSDNKDQNDGEISRLHLVFAEGGNGFAASVELADREDDIDLSYLEQFVGEEVQVQGLVAIAQASKPELLIEVRRKDQITVQ